MLTQSPANRQQAKGLQQTSASAWTNDMEIPGFVDFGPITSAPPFGSAGRSHGSRGSPARPQSVRRTETPWAESFIFQSGGNCSRCRYLAAIPAEQSGILNARESCFR